MTMKQQVVSSVVDQFRRPRGVGGRLAGWVMGHRGSNQQRNLWVVSLLEPGPDDAVLEIGFGPGVALEATARHVTDGVVHGVDHSEVMLRQAARRNRDAVRAGRMVLRIGTTEDLPPFDTPFDLIYAVNSHMFWHDLPRRVRTLHALLRPGGRLALGYQPRHPGATDEDARTEAVELTATMEEAGFGRVTVDSLPLEPMVVCVIATKGG